MCVIGLYEKDYPDLETLKNMEAMNGHGGGISYIENGKVKYEKGIGAKRIMRIIRKHNVKLPLIVHFRIASVGNVGSKLCHPFPISEGVPLDLKGEANAVLFHNGTYSDWQEICLKAVIAKNAKFPDGEWSDTRGIAWLISMYGENILNLIDGWNKFALMTPEGIKKYGEGWKTVKGVVCSNDFFDRPTTTSYSVTPYYGSSENYQSKLMSGQQKSDDEIFKTPEEIMDEETAAAIGCTIEELREILPVGRSYNKKELSNDVEKWSYLDEVRDI